MKHSIPFITLRSMAGILLLASAATITGVSCSGNNSDKAKAEADSIARADSIATADSIARADSIAKTDSIAKADSIANTLAVGMPVKEALTKPGVKMECKNGMTHTAHETYELILVQNGKRYATNVSGVEAQGMAGCENLKQLMLPDRCWSSSGQWEVDLTKLRPGDFAASAKITKAL